MVKSRLEVIATRAINLEKIRLEVFLKNDTDQIYKTPLEKEETLIQSLR